MTSDEKSQDPAFQYKLQTIMNDMQPNMPASLRSSPVYRHKSGCFMTVPQTEKSLVNELNKLQSLVRLHERLLLRQEPDTSMREWATSKWAMENRDLIELGDEPDPGLCDKSDVIADHIFDRRAEEVQRAIDVITDALVHAFHGTIATNRDQVEGAKTNG